MKNPQETPFEQLLRHAAQEPGLRPEFYRRLLDEDVLVPVELPVPRSPSGILPPGMLLGVVTLVLKDGSEAVPFFTSPVRVFEAFPKGEQCVVMTVRELFEQFRTQHPDKEFHINPYSTYGRSFTPDEVDSLLSTGALVQIEPVVLDDDDVEIGAVTENVEALLRALSVAFARNLAVRAGYAAQLIHPRSNETKAILVAIDAAPTADRDAIIAQATSLVAECPTHARREVDVAFLERDGSRFENYLLNKTRPFYRRIEH